MILTCPSCSTQYFADDKAIGETGRTVRCASCGHAWFQKVELSLEDQINSSDLSREKIERIRQQTEETIASPHQAYRARELARRKGASRLAASGAWAVTAMVFVGLGSAAVVKRDDVVRLWPKASAAYAMAGLDVNRFGLEFAEVDADRTFDGTTPILSLTGRVLNISTIYQPLPRIRVGLRDEYGRTVETVFVDMDGEVVAPGAQAEFVARLESPPLEAFDLDLSFVDRITGEVLTDKDKSPGETGATDPENDADHANNRYKNAPSTNPPLRTRS